ncbi:hypothetical protein [Nisaea sp.]|uniref:hypothetical protein n=1 Tax=Nisaea sp. TaxID=2024842 RepID=UPI003B51AA1B
MSARTIICTASDDRFFRVSLSLLRSIRDQQSADIDIGYLDLGLSGDNRASLSKFAPEVAEPGWDIDFSPPAGDRSSMSPGYKAMVSRPFLRDHFPGYETYIWIDADAWIQHWWAIEWLEKGARQGRLSIVPEMDRAYAHCFDIKSYVRWTVEQQTGYFGVEQAKRVGYNPVLNCGVFSMPAAHPVWGRWAEAMRAALSHKVGFFADQMSLNYVVYTTDHPRCFLPSTFNWLANMALPAFDPGTGSFVEPGIPYHPIGILHLAGDTKLDNQRVAIVGRDETMESRLFYDSRRRDKTGIR